MYNVFGYDDLYMEFSYHFDSFIKAVLTFRELNTTCITFITRDHSGTCLHVY